MYKMPYNDILCYNADHAMWYCGVYVQYMWNYNVMLRANINIKITIKYQSQNQCHPTVQLSLSRAIEVHSARRTAPHRTGPDTVFRFSRYKNSVLGSAITHMSSVCARKWIFLKGPQEQGLSVKSEAQSYPLPPLPKSKGLSNRTSSCTSSPTL